MEQVPGISFAPIGITPPTMTIVMDERRICFTAGVLTCAWARKPGRQSTHDTTRGSMRIRSHAPWMWVGMAAASVPTLGLSGAFVYLMRQEGRDSWFVYLAMAPFLLVGVLLAFFGLRALLRLAVRGSWQLEVPDEGGVLGHPLQARLFPTRERRPTEELTCRLRCIRIIRNTNASARNNVNTLWETTWAVNSAVIQPQLGLVLHLPLPDTGEPSQMDRTGSGVQWQLNVVVPLQDGPEEPVFDLPVRA